MAATNRLATSFPTVEPATLRAMIDAHLTRTSRARVQHFRLVLAERAVRAELRRSARNGVHGADDLR